MPSFRFLPPNGGKNLRRDIDMTVGTFLGYCVEAERMWQDFE
jgi:hypothetical protein